MALSEEPQEESLRSIFEEAEAKRQALGSTYEATSPSYRRDLDTALSLYKRVLEQISAISLFSLNEGLEDLATSALPYLLVDYHVAELVQKTPNLSPSQRKAILQEARAAYERFLALVDGYGLVTSPYDKLLERYRDDEEGFAVVASSDPATKRNGKIAAYKAEKQLRERLETLRRDPRYLEHGDEDVVRDLYLADIAFSIHATFHALDSLNRELPLLAQAPDPLAPSSGPEPADVTSRLDQPLRRLHSLTNPGGPLLSQQGKPLQPFTLVGSRADLARGVFRPGHNLPTMSIDEYLEEERRQGNILQGGEEPRPVVDEDDYEAGDRETYKARQWDDFKDENPRGSGNTLNMG
jgi:hypothetical protein